MKNNPYDIESEVLAGSIAFNIIFIVLSTFIFFNTEIKMKNDTHKFKEGDTVKAFMYNGFHKQCVVEEKCWYDKEKQSFVDYKTNEKAYKVLTEINEKHVREYNYYKEREVNKDGCD